MEPRVTEKQIELNGRTFVLKKWDARTGSVMLFKVLGIFGSAVKPPKAKGKQPDGFDMQAVLAAVTSIPEEDFRSIQDTCLKVCYEQLPAGLTPVINDEGKFGVIGLDNDTMTVLKLTIQSLIWNVGDFFSGEAMNDLLEM